MVTNKLTFAVFALVVLFPIYFDAIFFILSLRQVGHLISRVICISLFYQNSTCFFLAYFLIHNRLLILFSGKRNIFHSLARISLTGTAKRRDWRGRDESATTGDFHAR